MIRVLSELDAEKYWNLRLLALQTNPEAFVTTYEEALKKEDPIEQIAQNLQSHMSYTFGVFNESETLLGVVTLLTEQKIVYKHKGHIVAMYVDTQSRGNGYARELLQAAMKKAKELQIEQLCLGVISNNESAKGLYKSIGFKTYGIERRALKLNDEYRDEEYMVLFL